MIRCIAVDDETLALDIIEDNIRQIPFLQLVARCKTAFEAMQMLQAGRIDLIFLDIQMPGLLGTQFLRGLATRPMAIFITAYKKYAVDGFDLDAIDYLIKPVSFDRFLRAAHKALEYHQSRSRTSPPPSSPGYIFINTEYRLVKVFLNEIVYIEALKNYIRIHLSPPSRPILSRSTLKVFEEKLPAADYARVHKSFLVAIDKITSIENECIKIGNISIPLGKSYREEFLRNIQAPLTPP